MFKIAIATAALAVGPAFVSVAAAQTPQQAGVTAAVRGNVEIASAAGAVGKLVKSGEPVYLGNAIKSGPNSGLQILLLDQTTFTVGPNSEITIDKFVFDPQTGTGKVSASVAKGVFRFVTGKVAQTNPSDMEVKLPVGTIGIRGTIAMGSVDDGNGNGSGNGANGNPSAQIVLVGPGRDLEGNNRPGGLNLTGNNGGTQNVNQPGFGSVFGQGGWGTPQFFTPEMMGALQSRLTSFTSQGQGGQQGQGQQQGQGGQASQNAGAGQTQGKGNANTANNLNNMARLNQMITGDATNDQIRNNTTGGNFDPGTITGNTTFGQLRNNINGMYHFTQYNVPISDGHYDININIDGAARKVGVGDSWVRLATSTVNGVGYANVFDYNNEPGGKQATGFLDGEGDFYGTACGSSGICDAKVKLSFKNTNGQIAGKMQHSLEILTDQHVSLFTGSGTANAANGNLSDSAKLADGSSTYEQLRVQTAGKYYYSGSATLTGTNPGSYTVQADINFGTREFGGGNSKAVITGTNYSGTIPLTTINFTTPSGTATFAYLNQTNVTGAGCAGTNCSTDVRLTPQNVGGILAKTANHSVEVRNFTPGAVIASGSGTATRKEGVSP